MRILIDMDGVLSDFDGEFLKRWRVRHPNKIFIPLNKRSTFYVKDSYPDDLKPFVTEILLEKNFFRDMMPVEGGREALIEMESMGLDVFICTSPPSYYKNSVLEKYEWVEKNMGSSWVNRIMLTKDKTIVKAEILIDDKPAVSGVENIPAWELVLYDRPYNQGVDRKRITWNNWQSVILMERSK